MYLALQGVLSILGLMSIAAAVLLESTGFIYLAIAFALAGFVVQIVTKIRQRKTGDTDK
ncbi:hypothetical protein [Alkalicoccus urumqiensis]|uniref:hypothetical protein n=1 Tax=Alkalicoccus urumqiensis TaxID=1548213 RepID=UPI0015E6255E|nr:hypothetical protein [Alkalicoccus urumqiensis]